MALHAEDDSKRLALVRAFERAPRTWDVFLWSGAEDYDVLVGDGSHEGAIGFDPADPNKAVSETAAALADTGRALTVVTGARRGCGVSTLALHLSAALSSERDVCLLDLDPDSSLRARLGLSDEVRHWGHTETGVRGSALPLADGFRILLAPPDQRGDALAVVRAARQAFEHVVVDAPPSPWRAPVLGASSNAILVVPPSPQGIHHARVALGRHPQCRWSCVVNRVGGGGELTAGEVARRLGKPVTVELPCSALLRDREDDNRLLTAAWSRYFRRATRLAASLR